MKRLPLLLAAGLVLLLLGASPTRADTVRYPLGPSHGNVSFKATSRLVDADGRFHRFGGEVRMDPKALEQAVVSLAIDAASVDTGILRRDDHLRSEDFFHVTRFPQITFASRRVAPADGKVLVTGDLTLHGVSREVTVPIELEFSAGALRTRGEFAIRMSDYGMTYRSWFNPLRDEVRILFDLRGVPAPSGSPS
ncbi:MAG: YceI family protein [candidate division NC10 bacterium]